VKDAPALTLEHFKSAERWTAADRMSRLITGGIDQVAFATTDTGFVLSYPAKLYSVPTDGAAA
jgi:hypothetical protein